MAVVGDTVAADVHMQEEVAAAGGILHGYSDVADVDSRKMVAVGLGDPGEDVRSHHVARHHVAQEGLVEEGQGVVVEAEDFPGLLETLV